MKNAAIAILDEPTCGPRPAGDRRAPGADPRLQPRQPSRCCSHRICSRTVCRACDRVATVPGGRHRAHGNRRRTRPPGAGRGLCGRSRGRGRGSPTACANCRACSPWRRPLRARCPDARRSANCARRPPPPCRRQADAPLGRRAEPRRDTGALFESQGVRGGGIPVAGAGRRVHEGTRRSPRQRVRRDACSNCSSSDRIRGGLWRGPAARAPSAEVGTAAVYRHEQSASVHVRLVSTSCC